MKAITQEHPEGCALACAAMLAGRPYAEIAAIAHRLEIHAGDRALYTGSALLRRLLDRLGVAVAPDERLFDGWAALPDKALLATNWHMENDSPHWHWVVFTRNGDDAAVLDPAPGLDDPVRRDFSDIHPKWFIEVTS